MRPADAGLGTVDAGLRLLREEDRERQGMTIENSLTNTFFESLYAGYTPRPPHVITGDASHRLLPRLAHVEARKRAPPRRVPAIDCIKAVLRRPSRKASAPVDVE